MWKGGSRVEIQGVVGMLREVGTGGDLLESGGSASGCDFTKALQEDGMRTTYC